MANIIAMNISLLKQKTSPEIAEILAENVRKRRKERKLTQADLAKRSGVSLGSVKRFESSGEISLKFLLNIAIVLECEDDFLELFTRRHYKTIEDLINANKKLS